MPWDISHVSLDDHVIVSCYSIKLKLMTNNVLACHRLANSDRTIKNILNQKHNEQSIAIKTKMKGMIFFRCVEHSRSHKY